MIVESINKENELKFGPIQECCHHFKTFCRCAVKTKPVKNVNVKTDIVDQRTSLVQDVIDRHIKYGTEYLEQIQKLNDKYVLDVKTVHGIRIYK